MRERIAGWVAALVVIFVLVWMVLVPALGTLHFKDKLATTEHGTRMIVQRVVPYPSYRLWAFQGIWVQDDGFPFPGHMYLSDAVKIEELPE